MKISLMSWFHLKAERGMIFTCLLWDGAEQGCQMLLSDSFPYPKVGCHTESSVSSGYTECEERLCARLIGIIHGKISVTLPLR